MSLRNVAKLVLFVFLISGSAFGQDTAINPVIDIDIDIDIDLDPDALPREVKALDGEILGLWRDGRVFIGGQPDETALAWFREKGVTAVVNLRTTAEMDDREQVPFDEAVAVDSLGMEYFHIPLGGEEHPYTPATVDRLAVVLERHDGLVLVHCTVAWRASYVWSAYLVREHGFSLDGAMARGEAMAIGDLPIEGLLGRSLKLAYTEDIQ